MVTLKLHLNSVISTKGARYCTIDLKDIYLMTPMARPEYMRMKLKDLPAEFVELYNLTNKVNSNGYIHIKMGGLSEYHHKIDMSIHGPHQ